MMLNLFYNIFYLDIMSIISMRIFLSRFPIRTPDIRVIRTIIYYLLLFIILVGCRRGQLDEIYRFFRHSGGKPFLGGPVQHVL